MYEMYILVVSRDICRTYNQGFVRHCVVSYITEIKKSRCGNIRSIEEEKIIIITIGKKLRSVLQAATGGKWPALRLRRW